jgi:NAD(P)-dependent dehydrogenase (short-subunit alcohol dehydrogenase family)
VTGASRGIGRSIATALAATGCDVAITARTVEPGERREHSSVSGKSDTSPLGGSLTETAEVLRAHGARVAVVPADLVEIGTLAGTVATAVAELGPIDILVNNARFVGPGHLDRFLETPVDALGSHLTANATAPFMLCQLVLPSMIERGTGTIINIGAAAAYGDPTKVAGAGGWGTCYGMSKAAFQRIAGFVDVEFGAAGVAAYTVNPGVVAIDRPSIDPARAGQPRRGAPSEVIAAVVAWLAQGGERALGLRGRNIEAQFLCHELGLCPEWGGPEDLGTPIRYDEAGTLLKALMDGVARKPAPWPS